MLTEVVPFIQRGYASTMVYQEPLSQDPSKYGSESSLAKNAIFALQYQKELRKGDASGKNKKFSMTKVDPL